MEYTIPVWLPDEKLQKCAMEGCMQSKIISKITFHKVQYHTSVDMTCC